MPIWPRSLATHSSGASIRRCLLLAGALAIALAFAVHEGRGQHIGNDFAVFWQAGRNFATGHPLYHDYLPGARPLKYPPFAAMVFVLLGVFPLQVAGTLFSLLNLALWVAAVYLTRSILARTFSGRNQTIWPIVLGVVLSAQFFLDNFHHAQMNEVIFVLVLLGIDAYLRGLDVRAAAYVVTATAIKITPIFFVAWLIIRGRPRAALAIPVLALGCVLVPMVLRGPARGASELIEYYHSFLEGHQHGEISEYAGGQNLAALVNRMMRPAENPRGVSYQYVSASEPTAQQAYHALWLLVMLLFLGELLVLRVQQRSLSAFEISSVFLAGLLLSPITFTTHLVSLVFVYTTFVAIRVSTLSPAERVVAVLLGLGMLLTGLSGRDLVGPTIYYGVKGYSLMTWTMLLLFLAALPLMLRTGSLRQEAPAPTV
jgi:Glycosyltransferase family 87